MQGLGAALVSPAALSIVTTTFEEGAERNKALGVWGAVAGSGGAAGVLLGGMLTEWAGWEWVLFVNVPIGIVAALLAPRLLVESRDVGRERNFDVAGAFTVTAGLAIGVYALVDANNAGWTSTQTLVPRRGVARAARAASRSSRTRSRHPLVPFSIFRLRSLRGSNVVGLLIGMSLFSMFFFISLYLQQVLGYSALKTGLAYLPLALLIIVSAGARLAAGDQARVQADADPRDAVRGRRPAVVLAGLGAGRHLRRRRPVPVDAGRHRPRPLVRAGHHRRGHGDQAGRRRGWRPG